MNTWNKNINYNKKEFYISGGSQSEFINIKNKNNIIISTKDKNDKNYFLIFDMIIFFKYRNISCRFI